MCGREGDGGSNQNPSSSTVAQKVLAALVLHFTPSIPDSLHKPRMSPLTFFKSRGFCLGDVDQDFVSSIGTPL